jgi:hypothetical protein
MRELMAQRYPVYAFADLTINSREIPHDLIVDEILDSLLAGPLSSPRATIDAAVAPEALSDQEPSRT